MLKGYACLGQNGWNLYMPAAGIIVNMGKTRDGRMEAQKVRDRECDQKSTRI
ncbi:hypothetical protein CHK_0052 [Christensenella hongkongensis]|uniref:Uncharacterized protein n=1 Tax=Christensenella hongkongensis TaxID=270498 RepID=A0A0M2NQF1_9FIRM|nr:hypothetical protein CHK_0052 [Christensenella hongkongensis]